MLGATAAIPLQVIQKYLNFQFSVSLDLFGSETSSNVAAYYTAGLKGRWMETRRKDDHLLAARPPWTSRWWTAARSRPGPCRC